MQAGMAFMQGLAEARQPGARTPKDGNGTLSGSIPLRVSRDEETGQEYLELPLPPQEIVEQALGALSSFLERMKT